MKTTALYRIWSEDALIYVGVSCNPWSRLASHIRDKDWSMLSRRVDIEWHETRDAALRAEMRAIAAEKPLHNLAGVVEFRHHKKDGQSSCLAKWLWKTATTQKDLAKSVGMHFTAVSRLIHGKRCATLAQAKRIEAFTNGCVPAIPLVSVKIRSKTKDPAIRKTVVAMQKSGMSTKEIAERAGVSYTTIRNIAIELGIKMVRPRRVFSFKGDPAKIEVQP